MTTIKYRSDIDGLRAMAVLSVLMFHLNAQLFQGGFVGVDIFFVISGYLITGLLLKEHQTTGSIDFGHFYYRRLRRLFPALIAVLFLALVGSFFLLPPPSNVRGFDSTPFALLGGANFFFWVQSGYFDASKYLKPLLHTWILSVEEQFYLFWPLLILLGLKWFKAHLRWLVVLAIVFSFGLNALIFNQSFLEHFSQSDLAFFSYDRIINSAFYLVPFRAFEFAIGALLVYAPKSNERAQQFLSVIGFAIIIWSITRISATAVFPYYNALFVCTGTALIILSQDSVLSRLLLKTPASVFIGKLSYSLYLVHWPIIVFWATYKDAALTATDQIAMASLSFVAALILHFGIERRFRYSKDLRHSNSRNFVLICVALSILLIAASFAAKWGVGATASNYEQEVLQKIVASEASLNDASINRIRELQLAQDFKPFTDESKRNLLLIGDSMSNDLMLAFDTMDMESNNLEVRQLAISHKCQLMNADRTDIPYYKNQLDLAQRCNAHTEKLLNAPLIKHADAIVIAHNWYAFISDEGLRSAIEQIRSQTSAPIYLVGKRLFMTSGVSVSIGGALLKHNKLEDFNEYLYSQAKVDTIEVRIKTIAHDLNVPYLDMKPIQCDEASLKCFGLNERSELLYRDTIHWTPNGAAFFMRRLLDHPDFRSAFLGS